MSQLTELTHKLKEIFQINRADLDFGIFRILNTRRAEIERYLSETLPQAVKQAFGENQSEQLSGWKSELEQAKKQAQDLGIDPTQSPKVQDLQNKIAQAQKSTGDNETAVYRHLLTFFGRYYEDGDFISQRRYKGDTYAVPYAGEEVLLHWANKDQYYTKSGENFSNYRFTLADGRTVFLRLNNADIAKDNRKDNDAKRLFTLATAQTIERENEDGELEIIEIQPVSQSEDGNTLTILFDYKPFEKSARQDKILEKDLQTLLAHDLLQTTWSALADREPTEKNPNRTLLEKHLSNYTQKNTADYFIHKDLGGFLRRELDFYIKNEVMNLDELQSAEQFAHIEANLRLIQTLRKIALEIIDFLAQLENFQKKLWLKKKFVANSHYLITLNHIPQTFHETIFANAKQREQWQNLFAVKDLDINSISIDDSNPYAYLVVDTSLFPAEFQSELLTALSAEFSDGIDAHINGTLIHSDNFQALNLLQARYREQVKCIYIDPPYNANSSEIIYKNTYKHSSWLALMHNRLSIGKQLLELNGSQAIAIDEVEQEVLGQVLSQVFSNWTKACIPIIHNPRGQQGKNISYVHEYFFLMYPNDNEKFISDVKRSEIDSRNLRDSGTESDRTDAKNCFYPFYIQDGKIIGFGCIPEDDYHPSSANIEITNGSIQICPIDTKDYEFITLNINKPIIAIYPMTDNGDEKKWRYSNQSVKGIISKLEPKQTRKNIQIIFHKDTGVMRSLWVDTKYDASEYGTKILQSVLGVEQAKNFSYPKSIHTVSQIIEAQIGLDYSAIVLDYFAGSGTTAHAVINLNRRDNSRNHQYILVEQGEYFDTVLKPRVQKVIYSKAWKDGKPIAEDGAENLQGVPQIVKVLKLESYEDTLNNLELRRSDLFGKLPEQAQHDYLLHYMLNIESRDSLLNVSHFAKPFDYGLNISTTSAGAYDWQKVDLVETFNYLIGATVIGVDDKRSEQGFVAVECRLPSQHTDEKTLIFWRDCERIGYDELQKHFDRLGINPADSEYSQVYVNGDHTLETVWDGEQSSSLKIRSIEAEFLALMFAGDE